MTELIFNADDFGLSPSVNRSIAECAGGGLLTSASLMVTHAAAEEGVLLNDALDSPLHLGLHFCLTSGRACAPAEAIPLLAGKDGSFRHGFLSLARLLASRRRDEAAAQIGLEFRAQYARFEELLARAPGTAADHLDSHQHIHVFPAVMALCLAQAQKKNLVLRIPAEPIGSLFRAVRPPFLFHAKGLIKKRILDHYLRQSRAAQTAAPKAPIYFGIIDSGRMNLGAVTAVLKALPRLTRQKKFQSRQAEINLHPWQVTGRSEAVPRSASAADRAFGTSPHREEEFRLLINNAPQIRAQMSDLGIAASYFWRPAENRQDPEEA